MRAKEIGGTTGSTNDVSRLRPSGPALFPSAIRCALAIYSRLALVRNITIAQKKTKVDTARTMYELSISILSRPLQPTQDGNDILRYGVYDTNCAATNTLEPKRAAQKAAMNLVSVLMWFAFAALPLGLPI
jgi:hypothetical protein